MKIYYILIPMHFANAKEVAIEFKDKEFDTLGEIATSVTEALKGNDEDEDDEVLVYSEEAIENIKIESTYYTVKVFVK